MSPSAPEGGSGGDSNPASATPSEARAQGTGKLSRDILIGLFAGIAVGLFFGEGAGHLKIVGDAFIALLKMTVLP